MVDPLRAPRRYWKRYGLSRGSGGRFAGVRVSVQPVHEIEGKRGLRKGALRAEIELERRANVSVPMVTPVSLVLPLLGDGAWLCVLSCSVYEAGDVGAFELFREDYSSPPKCPRCSDGERTVLLAWHPRHDLPGDA